MNDFWVYLGIVAATLGLCVVWQICAHLMQRWLYNDWCRHTWGRWEDRPGGFRQQRRCIKCGYLEIREP